MMPISSPLTVVQQASPAEAPLEISVVMPCLDEEQTIGLCVERAARALTAQGLAGEIIVADNGSVDNSVAVAQQAGAQVVHQTEHGYGAAYMKGIAVAQGRYLLIGDSDNTYDFGCLPELIAPLRDGYDLVLGSRFKGTILPGAMPWANRYIGNPILTGMLNLLFRLKVSDAQTGLRAFTREAYGRMELQTTGMEFASEMIIKASLAGLKVTEVPITYAPRRGNSKLNPLGDAWRHIRFMLLFSPTYLFLMPGAVALALGLLILIALVRGPIYLGGFYVGIHFMVIGTLLAVLGVQMLSFGYSARLYAFSERLVAQDRWLKGLLRYFTLERGMLLGGGLAGLGLVTLLYILVDWLAGDVNFGQLIHLHEAIAASTLMMLGVQIIISSFFFSLLAMHRKHHILFDVDE